MDYRYKYLKYKSKYLQLRKLQKGGVSNYLRCQEVGDGVNCVDEQETEMICRLGEGERQVDRYGCQFENGGLTNCDRLYNEGDIQHYCYNNTPKEYTKELIREALRYYNSKDVKIKYSTEEKPNGMIVLRHSDRVDNLETDKTSEMIITGTVHGDEIRGPVITPDNYKREPQNLWWKMRKEPHFSTRLDPIDTPLTLNGARRVVDRIIEIASHLNNSVNIIYTSPFRRCIQTALIAAKIFGVNNVRINNGLSEIHTHDYNVTNYPAEEFKGMREIYEADREGWKNNPNYNTDLPEDNNSNPKYIKQWTVQDQERWIATLDTLKNLHQNKNILCVTHGDAVSAYSTYAFGERVYEAGYAWMLIHYVDNSYIRFASLAIQ